MALIALIIAIVTMIGLVGVCMVLAEMFRQDAIAWAKDSADYDADMDEAVAIVGNMDPDTGAVGWASSVSRHGM